MAGFAPPTQLPARHRAGAYWPALDGVRACAILAVMGFHFGVPLSRGGFVGVDVFFVLSGFLITLQLLPGANLGAFYLRRALRLLPALVVVTLAVAFYLALDPMYPGAEVTRGGIVATLLYVQNWRFALGDPYCKGDLLGHAWSLSAEEQFYLLWPLLLMVLQRRSVLPAALALALGSAGLRAVAHLAGVEPLRTYHGLDTRADALLIGAALAALFYSGADLRRWARPGAIGLLPIVGMIVAFGQPFAAYMHLGGFFVVAVWAACTIAHLLEDGWVTRLLSLPPLIWTGRISYRLYLWHAPVGILLTPEWTGLSRVPLILARVALSFVLAALSFYLIERPALRIKSRLAPR